MANLLTSIIVAFWVGGIALISVQNAQPVSLRFMAWRTIQIPLGLVLAFGAGAGMVGTAIALPFIQQGDRFLDNDDEFEES